MALAYVNSGVTGQNADPAIHNLAWSPTAGNLIVVAITVWGDGVSPSGTCTDNKGNTYTNAGVIRKSTDNSIQAQIWYSVITTGGSGMTVSVDFPYNTDQTLIVAEYSGQAASPTVLTNGAGGNSTNPTCGAVNPTGTNLYVAVLSHGANANPTESWTVRQEAQNNGYTRYSFMDMIGTGSQTGSWALATGQWACTEATFDSGVSNLLINVADCVQAKAQPV